jgi:hypothetical protein
MVEIAVRMTRPDMTTTPAARINPCEGGRIPRCMIGVVGK